MNDYYNNNFLLFCFILADLRTGENTCDSEDSLKLWQKTQNDTKALNEGLTEFNQKEISLQSKKFNNNKSGTESDSNPRICQTNNTNSQEVTERITERVVEREALIIDCIRQQKQQEETKNFACFSSTIDSTLECKLHYSHFL